MPLRLQPRNLFHRRGPRIADKHLIFLRYYHRKDAISPHPSHAVSATVDNKSQLRWISHDPRTCGTLPHSERGEFNATRLHNKGPGPDQQGYMRQPMETAYLPLQQQASSTPWGKVFCKEYKIFENLIEIIRVTRPGKLGV
jgi:hypothetical protein